MKQPIDEVVAPFLTWFAVTEAKPVDGSPGCYRCTREMRLLADGAAAIDVVTWYSTGTIKTAQDQDPTRDEPGDRA